MIGNGLVCHLRRPPASTLLSEDEKESESSLDVFFRIVSTSPNGVVNSLIRMPIVKKQKEAVCSVLVHSTPVGYFGDDQPLCALMLEQEENAARNRLWDDWTS